MLRKLLLNYLKIAFFVFLVSVPFGTRIIFYQFILGFHEYEAGFLYLSDVFMVIFLALFLWNNGRFLFSEIKDKIPLLIFLGLALISVFFAVASGLAFYNFIRLILLAATALAIGKLIRDGLLNYKLILFFLGVSAAFQSIVGFFQFLRQSSLGLAFLGESFLGINIAGVANIVIDGAKVIRAYGTFPHPNVLAAFLLLGLFSFYYLFLKSGDRSKSYKKIFLAIGIFIILSGLILTFSRTAWVIALLLSLSGMIYLAFLKERHLAVKELFLIFVFSIFILTAVFRPYIFERAKIVSGDSALSYRVVYNQLGIKLIKDTPWGIGIGNQVFYSAKNGFYEFFGLNKVWEWQPIHNLYLLIASEIGVLGLAAFIIFILKLIFGIVRKELKDPLVLVVNYQLLFSLLLFGLFDHFLWTLQPGRLMFWLTAGLVMGFNRTVRDSDSAPIA